MQYLLGRSNQQGKGMAAGYPTLVLERVMHFASSESQLVSSQLDAFAPIDGHLTNRSQLPVDALKYSDTRSD